MTLVKGKHVSAEVGDEQVSWFAGDEKVLAGAPRGLTAGNFQQIYNYYTYCTAQALNDEFVFPTKVVSGGTYSLELIYIAGAAYGILSIYVNDILVGTVDTYAFSVLWSQKFTQPGIVLTRGEVVVRIKVEGKNPASSSYQSVITRLRLYRTGS